MSEGGFAVVALAGHGLIHIRPSVVVDFLTSHLKAIWDNVHGSFFNLATCILLQVMSSTMDERTHASWY